MYSNHLLLFLKEGDKTTVNLIKKHILFFAVLVVLLIGSFVFLYIVFDIHQKDTYHINLSGKQRMLTQKASFLALKIGEGDAITEKKELLNLVVTMYQNHIFLSKELVISDTKLNTDISKQIDDLYTMVRGFIDKQEVNQYEIEFFIMRNQELLMMFERATTLKETLINEKFFQTKVILVVLCMILLVTVLVEALFIFKPAILEVIKKRAKLQTLNDQLIQRVEKEVAKRREQETMLIQKSKEAQVGELINNIAHQWRQPLSILKLYVQTIKFEYDNNLLTKENVEELTSKSDETINHMSQTIDDFRSFFLPSKEDKVFKVGDSLRKVEKLLEHMFLFEKINVENKYESGTINKSYVFGKGNDLEHCIMILLTNAKDAIVKRREDENNDNIGNIEVDFRVLGNRAVISIKDDGGGIPTGIRKNIFRQYFTTKEGDGTGVGLHMCKNIITDKYKGEITFSVEKEFTTFTIKLPLFES